MGFWLVEMLPRILLLSIALTGIAFLIRGRPRRRMLSSLHCGRCGYNLKGLKTERCPECGTSIAEVGGTCFRWTCRPVLLLIGVLLLLPSLAIPIRLGKRSLYRLEGRRYVPAALLLRQTQSPDWITACNGYNELQRRLIAGNLASHHVQELARLAAADCVREPPPAQELHRATAAVMGILITTGQLTSEHQGQFFEQLVEVSMKAAPAALRSKGIPVVLRLRSRAPLPSWVVYADEAVVRIARDHQKPDLPTPPIGTFRSLWPTAPALKEELIEQPCLVHMSLGPLCERALMVIAQDVGRCEMDFWVAIDLYSQPAGSGLPKRHLYRLTRRFTLVSEVAADPSSEHP